MMAEKIQTEIPVGTITFLFTDIEGSTKLWDKYPKATGNVLAIHNDLIQNKIKIHGGYVFKNLGDGFCAAFTKALDALEAALECQYSLQNQEWPEPIDDIKVRMAIHSGAADMREGDYFGPPLNRVSRMESAAHGGQVILSQTSRQLLYQELPPDVELINLGEHRLRSLQQPENIFQVLKPGMLTDFPPLRTQQKESSNLPNLPTPFIGRKNEIKQISKVVSQPNCRLLTLTGPGGIGKTRLALQAAAQLVEHYPQGTYFIPLAPIDSSENIIPTLADELNFIFDIHSSNLDPKEQFIDYLKDKRALLILDNFEHLLDGAGLVAEILERTQTIKLLITSRERLNLQAEWLFDVKNMRYPQNGSTEDIRRYSAVKLFLDRAQKAEKSFSLSEEEKPHLSRICQLVDGSPLGLELAAAWVSMLSCQEIAEEIDRNIDFLSTTLQDVPERHKSVRAAFEYSWNLLTEAQRASYRRLMVFRGGFDREAARAVSDVNLLQLVQLVNKSLLWRSDNGRYERHELLAQFTLEKLSSLPEEKEAALNKHSQYFLNYLSDRAHYLYGQAMVEFRGEIRLEIQNIKMAVIRAVKQWPDDDGRSALGDLGHYYTVQGWHEGLDTFRVIVKDIEADWGTAINRGEKGYHCLLSAKIWLANFYSVLGRHEQSEEIAQELLPKLRREGHTEELAICLLNLGINAAYRGEYAVSKSSLEESVAVGKAAGIQSYLGSSLIWLGWAEYSMGDYQNGQDHFQQAHLFYLEAENYWGMAFSLSKLGLIADAVENFDLAVQYHEEAREIFISLGDIAGEGYTLSRLSLSAYGLGEYQEAKRLGIESYNKFEEIGHRWGTTAAKCRTGFASLGLGELNEAEDYFLDAFEQGLINKMTASALYALCGLACVFSKIGKEEVAAQTFFFVLNNPGTPAVYKTLIEPYFMDLKQVIDPDLLAQAEEEAKGLRLEDFASVKNEFRQQDLAGGV